MTSPSTLSDPPTIDAHDAKREANVHPDGWVNPVPAKRYHLVVVGAGTAGLVSAAVAAGLGARVALVERHLMGGDCLNVGCVPSKGVIAGARAWHDAHRSEAVFAGPAVDEAGSFAAVMTRMRRVRADLSRVDSAARFRDLGVDVFFGQAAFAGPDVVTVGEQSLRFRRAVIATGARPAIPPIDGLDTITYHTNETIFDLTEVPKRLVVIGGGPIGCELAQAMARLGSTVTLLDHEDRLLPHDDPDAAALVAASLRHDGVTLELGVTIDTVKDTSPTLVTFSRGGETMTVAADTLLLATGRTPNVEDLGLERAGVAHDRKGITVDDRLRTTNRNVFAAGDVASKFQFTHAADFQARIVVANALFPGRQRASDLIIPWATYTDPEVAHVGLTAAQASTDGVAIDTVTVEFADVDRAVLEGTTEGFLRLHLAQGTSRIVGATVVGPHAGDMIAEATLAMTRKIGIDGLGATIHPYPTLAEAYRKAADQWRRGKLTPLLKRVLRWWFRFTS